MRFLSIDIFLNLAFPFQNEVSDLMYNWVAQRPDFKSALRVVKMVLNTQCYQYLWLTMWFHAKKSKETLKKSKSLILLCRLGIYGPKRPNLVQNIHFGSFWAKYWHFLVISELGSRIYIVKSAILIFWVFLSIFLHEITL